MRKYAAAWAFFLILLVAAIIGACAKPYHEETEKYYFVATNVNLPYWQEAQGGFMEAATGLRVKGAAVGPATYDPGAGATMVRGIVEEQPGGIGLSPSWNAVFMAAIR